MKRVISKGLLFLTLCFMSLITPSVSAENQLTAADEELTIVAHVVVKPEFKDEVLKATRAVVDGTRTEAGNASYVLYEHTDNPLKFTLIEVWKSQAAIDTHNNTNHFKAFVKAIDGKADLEVYTMKKKF